MKDLVLLVADKNMQGTLRGALGRPASLNIRPISSDFRIHAGRDGGARVTGPDLLSAERQRFRKALLVFDLEGSGSDNANVEVLEADLNRRLGIVWGDDAKSIVIKPEVDIWMWASDNALSQVLDWRDGASIRSWLRARNFEFDELGKPLRPKEALALLVRQLRRPRSSALYEKVASTVSLANCQDVAFGKLRHYLNLWFAP